MGIKYKKATRIRDLRHQLKPGDHVRVKRKGYYHHFLVVKVINNTQLWAIHYSNETGGSFMSSGVAMKSGSCMTAKVVERKERVNPTTEIVERLTYSADVVQYRGGAAVQRARQRLGEQRYHVLFNNCESFVNWCITNQNVSNQGKKALKGLAFGAIAAGLGVLVPGVGAIGVITVGLAAAGASYTYLTLSEQRRINAS